MGIKLVSFLSTLLFANGALALDTSRCPVSFDLTLKVERVYKTSDYDMVPGWSEAQETLQNTKEIKSRYTIVQPDPSACVYLDENGNEATLATSKFRDPEERNPVLVDQLTLRFKIEDSSYVSYLPIKDYSKSGMVTHSRPYSMKIKTRLYYPQTKKTVSFDLGMVSATIN